MSGGGSNNADLEKAQELAKTAAENLASAHFAEGVALSAMERAQQAANEVKQAASEAKGASTFADAERALDRAEDPLRRAH